MAEGSDLERTEEPSQRRLDQARDEGQVARSRELSTFAVLLAGGAGLWLMGAALSAQLTRLLRDGLTLGAGAAFDPGLLLPRLYTLSLETLMAFLPLLLLLFVTAALSPLLLNGWMFSAKPLQPDFSKLDPLSGIGRMFSAHGLIELGKAVGKSLVVGGIGAWAIWYNKEEVLMLAAQPAALAIPQLGQLMWMTFAAIMGGMLLIVAVDVPFQLWEHSKKLKMTKEEVRQESRETEGDPQIKGRIRSMQREMARRRMMAEIPTADVVVTNPTRYAVALRYRERGMKAPVVVAKGSHLLAARIREIAVENKVPILEAPPLARALHKHTGLGETIPEALYTAVAEVLAYVYQLRRYRNEGGAMPDIPHDLPVPPQLDPATPIIQPGSAR
ncbi:MAG: flagellar type III secretion system protein FlhB [Nitrosomonadales bacterium]|nr:flagellar type III secretion system protein FlhB [Nitrosomonadales bacterium]